MLLIYLLGIGFVHWMARFRDFTDKEALGYGDVNLCGVVGLLLGWPGIIAGILLTVLIAGAVSLFYLFLMLALRKYRSSLTLPFGPFLVGSAIIFLFLKDTVFAFLP
jgi:leader peptidase (prepilin peptidase)/N-methyltransferase